MMQTQISIFSFIFLPTFFSIGNSYVTFTFGDSAYSHGEISGRDSTASALNQSLGINSANIPIHSISAPFISIPAVPPSTSTAMSSILNIVPNTEIGDESVMRKMIRARQNLPSQSSSETGKTNRPLTKMLTPTVPVNRNTISGNSSTQVTRRPRRPKVLTKMMTPTVPVTMDSNTSPSTQVTRTPKVLASASLPSNTTTEVCSPSLPRECMMYESVARTIADREECLAITHTVCQEVSEEVDNDICVVKYSNKKEHTTAKNYKLVFENNCTVRKELTCQSTPADGYIKKGDQYCKEVDKDTCYNIPMVKYMMEPVTVSYPVAVIECVKRPIILPQILCKNITKDHCVRLPDTKKDIIMLEYCGVSLGPPSCQVVETLLPQAV